MATYRCFKWRLSLESRVKHGAVSGYTAALNHPSVIQKFAFDLLFLFSPVRAPATCKAICLSFSPRSEHSAAGQVSDLFAFSLF